MIINLATYIDSAITFNPKQFVLNSKWLNITVSSQIKSCHAFYTNMYNDENKNEAKISVSELHKIRFPD